MIPGVLVYRALFAFIDMSGVVGEVTIAMMPPTATTQSRRRGMLKIMENPTADMAAATANSR